MFFSFRQSALSIVIFSLLFNTGALTPALATPSALIPLPAKKTEAKIELHSPTTISPTDNFSFTVLYKEKGTSFFKAKNLAPGQAEVRLWFIDPLFKTAVDKGVLTPIDTTENYELSTATWLSGTYSIRVNAKEVPVSKKQKFTQKAEATFLLKSNTAGGVVYVTSTPAAKKPATVPIKKISKVPAVPVTYPQVVTGANLIVLNPSAMVASKKLRLRVDLYHENKLLNGARGAAKVLNEFPVAHNFVVKIVPLVDTTPPPVTVSENPLYDVKPAPADTTFTPAYTVDKGVLVVDLMKAMGGKPLPGESVPYMVYVEYATGLTRVNEVPVLGTTNLRLFNSPISNWEASEIYDKESATLPPPPAEIMAAEDPNSGTPVTSTPTKSGTTSPRSDSTTSPNSSEQPKKPAEDQPDKYASLPQGSQTKSSSEPTKPVNDSPDEPTASEDPNSGNPVTTTPSKTVRPTATPTTTPTTRATTTSTTRAAR